MKKTQNTYIYIASQIFLFSLQSINDISFSIYVMYIEWFYSIQFIFINKSIPHYILPKMTIITPYYIGVLRKHNCIIKAIHSTYRTLIWLCTKWMHKLFPILPRDGASKNFEFCDWIEVFFIDCWKSSANVRHRLVRNSFDN